MLVPHGDYTPMPIPTRESSPSAAAGQIVRTRVESRPFDRVTDGGSGLANIQSAIKRIRSSGRKQAHNQASRTRARSAVKEARLAIDSGSAAETAKALQEAYSRLDRAAKRGVIHKRNAARRKSRLMKRLAKQAGSSQA